MSYAELHAVSAFSFLRGASYPDVLAEEAARLGLPAMALVDVGGVYGAPRFYKAAKAAGLRPLVGAEIQLAESPVLGKDPPRLTLLSASQQGYKNLCRLISQSAADRPKGQAQATWAMIESAASDLHCLTGGDEGLLASVRESDPKSVAQGTSVLERLTALFPHRLHVELQRHFIPSEEFRNQALLTLSKKFHLPVVATNGVKYAFPHDKDILDVMTCIRAGVTLETAGTRLLPNREAHLKKDAEMRKIFSDYPQSVDHAGHLAEQLTFTLDDLGYRFPEFPLPSGHTPSSYLRHLTWSSVPQRFKIVTSAVRAQLDKELALIEKLNLAGYFLIVWDIIQFCKQNKILVQGRGSAANSSVCYALSITAIDPIKMDLLFERFLSDDRHEWPDIDLDLPSGDQREKVIQYLYQKYGSSCAAMTANVMTYQSKSAMREVSKVFGYGPEQIDLLSREVGSLSLDRLEADPEVVARRLASVGFLLHDRRLMKTFEMWGRFQGLPRHLGQHSGGMVIAAQRLNEIVPIEPASMPGRMVIQWDKDDCADLKIIKIDILGLGMLQAIEESLAIVNERENVPVDMAHMSNDDPKVYQLLRDGDTIGLFQVESRAQIAALPRHPPRCFYDLVTQIALVRPGPILGGMMWPFYRRFLGQEKVTYPHPRLEPILERTLGVPLFQEQILRIAMEVGGFSGGEAEQLRRAMGSTRSIAKMKLLGDKLRVGMTAGGIERSVQDQIVQMILGFASYGFPESHAASFALIAYTSAYLKVYHPAAFYTALLNAWPMGFYHPATLVKDAQRRHIEVLGVDVQRSGWECRWESKSAFRLGLRYVQGLSKAHGLAIEQEASTRPFDDIRDLTNRCVFRRNEIEMLAYAGALQGFGLTRREALWQVAQAERTPGPLFAQAPLDLDSPLIEMNAQENTLADYRGLHLTAGPHLMEYYRQSLRARNVMSYAELMEKPSGSRVRAAGFVIVRQHPPTAKGFVFLTLEDETGMTQAILTPTVYAQCRSVVLASKAVIVEGRLQKEGHHLSVKTDRVRPLSISAAIASHDFH